MKSVGVPLFFFSAVIHFRLTLSVLTFPCLLPLQNLLHFKIWIGVVARSVRFPESSSEPSSTLADRIPRRLTPRGLSSLGYITPSAIHTAAMNACCKKNLVFQCDSIIPYGGN